MDVNVWNSQTVICLSQQREAQGQAQAAQWRESVYHVEKKSSEVDLRAEQVELMFFREKSYETSRLGQKTASLVLTVQGLKKRPGGAD